jgi:hypothetical protein
VVISVFLGLVIASMVGAAGAVVSMIKVNVELNGLTRLSESLASTCQKYVPGARVADTCFCGVGGAPSILGLPPSDIIVPVKAPVVGLVAELVDASITYLVIPHISSTALQVSKGVWSFVAAGDPPVGAVGAWVSTLKLNVELKGPKA